jgi:RecA-family ATPase
MMHTAPAAAVGSPGPSPAFPPMTASEIAGRLESRKLDVLTHLFPAGCVSGAEYCVGSLSGESGESLKVHLNGSKGPVWKDFATGDSGGDLLDLWAQSRCGGDIGAAIRDAAAWLGCGPKPHRQRTDAADLHKIPTEHRDLGRASIVFPYRNAWGRVIGAALRWNLANGDKEIRPFDAVAGRWTFPVPRPLYYLDILTEEPIAPVVVVEGEPCAAALLRILRPHGFVVTTCWGGAESAGKADLSPLRGRPRVILWPDADEPGRTYIETIARDLRALDPQAVVLAVEPPSGVPEGWDAADAVAEDMDVVALIAAARPFAEVEDDPLERILIPAGTLTLAEMEKEENQPQFAIAHLAPCEVTTLISALGGTGKTLLLVQMLIEAHLGLPIWGCEDFVASPRTWLYVNTEDGTRWLNRWAAPLLRAFKLDRLPFDMVPMKELAEVPVLDARLGQRLARMLERRGHGGIVIDPKIGLMPGSQKIIDSTGLRQFMREGLHPIEKTGAAVIVSDHDNRLGQAVAGAVSQQDYARLVLHVIAGEKTDRVRRITLKREKDNTGFSYEEIELERDNVTLVSRVVRTRRTTDGATEPCPAKGPERRRALRRLALAFIGSRSEENSRSKEQATAWMLAQAHARWGDRHGTVGRADIRDFLSAFGRWREKTGKGGGQVLCGLDAVDA